MAHSKMPETPEEISAFFTKMEEKDKEDVRLDLHFSQQELDAMTDFEKLRLGNLKRNYQTMKELGNFLSFILSTTLTYLIFVHCVSYEFHFCIGTIHIN